MANSINVGKAEERDAIGENEQLQRGKLNHDIRASLAISKGFNQALETSFSDLVAGYQLILCLLYTSPSPRDRQKSRMPSSA